LEDQFAKMSTGMTQVMHMFGLVFSTWNLYENITDHAKGKALPGLNQAPRHEDLHTLDLATR
jgi:hypothetical protein